MVDVGTKMDPTETWQGGPNGEIPFIVAQKGAQAGQTYRPTLAQSNDSPMARGVEWDPSSFKVGE